MSNWRVRLLPSDRREWGEAYLADFGEEAKLGRLMIHAWMLELGGGEHMRIVVTTTSISNALLGVFMAGLFWLNGPNPPLVAITAGCLCLQGGYTLWHMYGKPSRDSWAKLVLVSGETIALLVGIGGFVGSVLQTAGTSVDPEYGPIAIAGAITAQAAATLYFYVVEDGPDPVSN